MFIIIIYYKTQDICMTACNHCIITCFIQNFYLVLCEKFHQQNLNKNLSYKKNPIFSHFDSYKMLLVSIIKLLVNVCDITIL